MPKRTKHRGRNWMGRHREPPRPSYRTLLWTILGLVVLYGLFWVFGDSWLRLAGIR